MVATLFVRQSSFPILTLLNQNSLFYNTKPSYYFSTSIHSQMGKNEITEEEVVSENVNKNKVFVAGATGSTGKRIVQQLLAKGFAVKAAVRDLDKAKSTFSSDDIDNPHLQFPHSHKEEKPDLLLNTMICSLSLPYPDKKLYKCLKHRVQASIAWDKNMEYPLHVLSPDIKVKADVTEGSEKLADAIGNDSDTVICATGFRRSWDLTAPWKVDNFGTVNLVEASRKVGANRFVLISSILVNGAAMGQILNPAYIFLNVLGLTLVAKLQAEQHIRKSGINYTIIRPGGLKNDPPSGNVIMEPEDTLYEGSISRDQVAEVAVEALLHPEASSYKVVEIVARPDAPKRSYEELFGSIKEK
ncbi:hypothetical protein ACFE04_012021 [Oxalis oulophora]